MSKKTIEHWSQQAPHYARSKSQSNPSALAALVETVNPGPEDIVLDVATGAGFTAVAFAPYVRTVYATDLSTGMLEQAQILAKEKGLSNLHFQLANAESLSFPSGFFDIVTCRLAAHHFPDLEKAVQEMRRVTRPGGKIAFLDTCAPEEPDLAALMNELEKRRDATHFCNRSPSALHCLFARCGLKVVDISVADPVGLELSDWVKRAGTPPQEVEILREMFVKASPGAAEAFQIEVIGEEIHFGWETIRLIALKPRLETG